MNEEEIMDIIKGKLLMIKRMLEEDDNDGHASAYEMQSEDFEAIQGLLKLYNKEKEKNKEHKTRIRNLECKIIRQKEQISGLRSKYHVDAWLEDDYISKDKIKAKIEEVEQWELYNMKIPRLSTLDERLGAKIGIKYVLQSLLEEN